MTFSGLRKWVLPRTIEVFGNGIYQLIGLCLAQLTTFFGQRSLLHRRALQRTVRILYYTNRLQVPPRTTSLTTQKGWFKVSQFHLRLFFCRFLCKHSQPPLIVKRWILFHGQHSRTNQLLCLKQFLLCQLLSAPDASTASIVSATSLPVITSFRWEIRVVHTLQLTLCDIIRLLFLLPASQSSHIQPRMDNSCRCRCRSVTRCIGFARIVPSPHCCSRSMRHEVLPRTLVHILET
mmetsp:Transcript_12437/g.27194  ORF Transcript_12437/g.27194 Transcript_12437/m.27194 type:complete len:235 (+) Transcript_12437:5353-6057(+)